VLKVERIVVPASVECRVRHQPNDQSRGKLAGNDFLERHVSEILWNGERLAEGPFCLIFGRAIL